MKLITATLALTFILTGSFSVPQSAEALSCIQMFSRIGTVESIAQSSNTDATLGQTIVLKDLEKIGYNELEDNENINLVAEKVVGYIDNGNTPAAGKEFSEDELFYQTELDTPGELNVAVGDVVSITGPLHVCSLALVSVYGPEGDLKQVWSRGGFGAYEYNDVSLTAVSGEVLSCESNTCTVKTDFTVGNETYTLAAGDAESLSTDPFTNVELFKSTDTNPDSEMYNWGMDESASHIATFALPESAPVDPEPVVVIEEEPEVVVEETETEEVEAEETPVEVEEEEVIASTETESAVEAEEKKGLQQRVVELLEILVSLLLQLKG